MPPTWRTAAARRAPSWSNWATARKSRSTPGLDAQHRRLPRPGRHPHRSAQGHARGGRARGRDTSIWLAKVARKEYAVGLPLTGVGLDDPDVNLYESYSRRL